MLKKSKNVTITGNSTISINGADVVVMTMNSTIGENGSVNITKNVQNKDNYLSNKEAVDADFIEFETYVNSLLEV